MLFNYQNIHVELSSKCTLKCPRCPRTELHPDSLNKEISISDFMYAFPADILKNIKKFLFCGDIGDPIYAKDLVAICRYIKVNSQASIFIVTNGSYKEIEWWQELGSVLTSHDQVTFSVDGYNNYSNNLYRVNSNWDSILNGIKSLRESSNCVMQWSAIYFNFNEDHMHEIEALAYSLGFDKFQSVKSSKFDGRYLINNVDPLKPNKNFADGYQYQKLEKQLTNKTIQLTDISKSIHPWARCLNHAKEIFISVEGLVFPCPWFNAGYQENTFVQKNINKLSIKNRPLLEVLNDPVWSELNFDNSPLEVCNIKCKHG